MVPGYAGPLVDELEEELDLDELDDDELVPEDLDPEDPDDVDDFDELDDEEPAGYFTAVEENSLSHVWTPTTPSTVNLLFFWKLFTAANVCLPNTPSTVPAW